MRVGLSLSGGGFRASLFHLGVLKRLDELGILERVTHISGVSGGAVLAALYVYLKREKGSAFKFEDLEMALLAAVKKNPRTRWLVVIALRRVAFRLLPLWLRVPLERWLKAIAFDGFFRRYFFGARTLDYLDPATRPQGAPSWPILILNTTSLEIGQDFYFTPTYIGPREDAAMALVAGPSRTAPKNIAIAQAVGASACVPAIFPPYTISVNPDRQDDNTPRSEVELRRTHLVDGGVYDNQGFRVFLTEPNIPSERVDYLIASDASKTMAPSAAPLPAWYSPFKLFALLFRSHGITEDRARWERFALLLYKLQAGHICQAAFFHTDTQKQEGAPYRLPDEMTRHLARLRTDFDSFSDVEIAALMYHGYTLVNHRVFNYCQDLLPTATAAALAALPAHAEITWQGFTMTHGSPPPGVAPLQTWPDFIKQVQKSIPPRGWFRRILLNWLEKPWRPALDEKDPTVPSNPAAWQTAVSHVKRGSIGSLVWRGLQRLGDRGGFWRLVAPLGKTLIVLALLYLLRELLIVLLAFLGWLIGQSTRLVGSAGWLNELLDRVASIVLAVLKWLWRLIPGV